MYNITYFYFVYFKSLKGKTDVFTRKNQYLGTFSSFLPGGRRFNFDSADGNRSRGVTVLDCIWSDETETFYVLDILVWSSVSMVDFETEARQFLLHSKFEDTPRLSGTSRANNYKFTPLKMFSAELLPETLTLGRTCFPEQIDGLLLYDKSSVYLIGEITQHVLWVQLTDISALLGITPCPELLAKQRPEPENPRYYLEKPHMREKEKEKPVYTGYREPRENPDQPERFED